jgi:pimeloyl-ACP methyl ester carboxylesterase
VLECGGVDRRSISNESIIAALQAPDAAALTDPGAAAFRRLADAVGADREALLAQARAVHRDGVPLERIRTPTLVLAGHGDPLAARPQVLCAAIAGARLQMVSGDHMQAVADPAFARALVDFLAGAEVGAEARVHA